MTTTPVPTHILTLAAGLAIGMGGVAIASGDEPSARSAASSDSRIVNELRTLNKSIVVLNKSVGGYQYVSGTPLDQRLRDIDATMQKVCSNTGAIDGAPYRIGC